MWCASCPAAEKPVPGPKNSTTVTDHHRQQKRCDMIPDRIEYLLMLARDERQENDSLIDKQNEIFAQRALRLLELESLHQETGRILQEELKRFNRWMPKGQQRDITEKLPEQMPRVVQKGPAPQVNPLLNMREK